MMMIAISCDEIKKYACINNYIYLVDYVMKLLPISKQKVFHSLFLRAVLMSCLVCDLLLRVHPTAGV